MAKQPKNKFYPLKGEAEMANELNKIERSRPKGYRDGAPEKPLFKKGFIHSVIFYLKVLNINLMSILYDG